MLPIMPVNPSKLLRRALPALAVAAVIGLAGCSNNDMSNMPTMDHGSASAPAPCSPGAPPPMTMTS